MKLKELDIQKVTKIYIRLLRGEIIFGELIYTAGTWKVSSVRTDLLDIDSVQDLYKILKYLNK